MMKIGKNIVTPIVWSYFSYFSFCPDPSFQTLSDLRVSIYREHRYIMNDLNELSCSVVFFLQLFIIKFYSFLHFYAFCNCIISLPPFFFIGIMAVLFETMGRQDLSKCQLILSDQFIVLGVVRLCSFYIE